MQRPTLLALVMGGIAATACSQVLGLNSFSDSHEAGATTGGSAGAGASGGTSGTTGDASSGSGGTAPGGAAGDASTCTCLPAAPTGWSGPLAFVVGKTAPPACTPEWNTFVDHGGTSVNASPASCAQCSCSVSSSKPAMCSVIVTTTTDTACGGCTDTTNVGSGCTTLAQTCSSAAAALKSATIGNLIPGNCTPDAVTNPTPSKATFADQARACVYNGAGSGSCGLGKLCMPPPPSGYPPRYCIAMQGLTANCSASQVYTQKYVVATSIKDDRSCSACACSTTVGGSCKGVSATVSFHTDKYCTVVSVGGATFTGSWNGCSIFQNLSHVDVTAGRARATATANNASCAAPTGGAPIGSAVLDPKTSWVFCCTK